MELTKAVIRVFLDVQRRLLSPPAPPPPSRRKAPPPPPSELLDDSGDATCASALIVVPRAALDTFFEACKTLRTDPHVLAGILASEALWRETERMAGHRIARSTSHREAATRLRLIIEARNNAATAVPVNPASGLARRPR